MRSTDPGIDPVAGSEEPVPSGSRQVDSDTVEGSTSVTVLIPSYNGSEVILDAIESVRDQRGLRWNLLVVDDASSDDSFRLVSRMTRDDERVELIRNPRNLGISATLNRGLRLATGAFVLILHQDCRLESSDWLVRAVGALRSTDAVCLAGTPHHDVGRMPRVERWFWITRNHIYSERARSSDLTHESLFSENKCDLFDTEFLRDLGGFDERTSIGGEDQLLAEKLARNGQRVYRDPRLGFSLTLGETTTMDQNLRKEFLYGQEMRAIYRLVGRRAIRKTPDGGVDRRLSNRLFGVAWIFATVALLAATLVLPPVPAWLTVVPLVARAVELESRAVRAAEDYDLRPADLIAIPLVGLVGDVCYLGGLLVPTARSIERTPGPGAVTDESA